MIVKIKFDKLEIMTPKFYSVVTDKNGIMGTYFVKFPVNDVAHHIANSTDLSPTIWITTSKYYSPPSSASLTDRPSFYPKNRSSPSL